MHFKNRIFYSFCRFSRLSFRSVGKKKPTDPNQGKSGFIYPASAGFNTKSVLVEVFLQLLVVVGLRQTQLQQNTSLLRIERAGRHKPVLVVVHFGVLRGGARRNAGAADHGDTVLRGLFKDREDGLMKVAVTDAGVNDAVVLRINQSLSLNAFHAAVRIDDADLRQLRELRHVKRRFVGVLAQRLTFVGDLVVEDRADLTKVAGNERFRLHRVGLHHVAGVYHDVVHRNHDALLGGFLFRGRQNGVVEIAGTVSTETGRRQHGAHEHHGLLAAQREVSSENYKRFMGRELEVLFDAESRHEGFITGKSDEFIIVEAKGDASLIGQRKKVKITKTYNWAVSGEII